MKRNTKMKNPFANKNHEQPEKIETEKIPLLSDVNENNIDNFSEAQLVEIVKAVPDTSQLRERHRAAAKYCSKLASKAFEIPDEKRLRRGEILAFVKIMGTEIRSREKAEMEAAHAKAVEWVAETIPKILPDLRWCLDGCDNFRLGIITLDACHWEKFGAPELTVKLESGYTETFDLRKMPPATLRHLLDSPFSPTYIRIESGAMKDGKPFNGVWQANSFAEAQKIKVSSDRHVMLMRV